MQSTIDAFVATKRFAIVGASASKDNWASALMRMLGKEGYDITPIGKEACTVEGREVVTSIGDLPEDVEHVIFAVPPAVTMELLPQCVGGHVKRVWLHKGAGPGSGSPEAVQFCKDNGLEVVYGLCPMMMFPPGGFHRVHLFFRKLFGGLPPELKKKPAAG